MLITFGTCSWNYDSWVGLVYTKPYIRAVDYLNEYSQKYRMVEIDSWFYRMPTMHDVRSYVSAVDPDFRFICKAPRDLTVTCSPGKASEPNPYFLSPEFYQVFHDTIEPLAPQITAIVLEFEYLNKQKMPNRKTFISKLDAFLVSIPRDIPIALEPRNGPYLDADWFWFLQDNNVIHVFSEKLYMPPITDLYEKYSSLLGDTVIIRLLGGDRGKIEEQTSERWDKIVDPKPQLPAIARMISDLDRQGKAVHVDVNNHFEGSAPLTIERLKSLLL